MMTRKSVLTIVAAVVVAASLGGAPAMAKNSCSRTHDGKHGCANEIRACWSMSHCKTSSVKGKARTACIKKCRHDVVAACQAHELDCSLSPSGAFLSAAD